MRTFLLNFPFGIVILLTSPQSWAYFEETDPSVATREMNGIRFDEYKEFTKKWHLVTTRYREDSGELRLVFANDRAWGAMKGLMPNYPDGSVFGKVGFATERDPSFTSSLVPSGAKRYQFMVKNRKKYADTDGWGYALFESKGHLYKGDVRAQTLACASCHRVVPERNFVFSRPMLIHHDSAFPAIPTSTAATYRFRTILATELPKALRSEIISKSSSVESLTGEIQVHAFSGTLDEIVPLLLARARSRGAASVLLVDPNNFTLVDPLGKSKACGEDKLQFKITILSNGKKVRDHISCQ